MMTHKILCVDDEPDTVDSLGRLFRKRYQVLKATSGQQGLEQLSQHPDVSLIISDQRMPEMTGVEFLSESIKVAPNAMRILLTGYTDIESVVDAINSGQIYRYLTKPWDPVDLSATVDQAITKLELQSELKQKNEALKKALDELQELDQAKTQFMILINHELKTPLTSMMSFLQLLQESQLDEEQKLYTKRVGQSVDRLNRLIENVLLMIRAETGNLEHQITSLNLTKICNDLKSKFESSLSKKSLKLSVVGDQSANGDEKICAKIFENLLDNAIKFANDDSELKIAIKNDCVEFHNEGTPIDEEKIEKILKPFVLDENMMNHSTGLGLGLSQSVALAKVLGWQLSLAATATGTVAVVKYSIK